MAEEASEAPFLTVAEANEALPAVEAALQEMDLLMARRKELADLVEDLEAYWGEAVHAPDHPDHGEHLRLHDRLAEVTAQLDASVRAIHEVGGHLKSYEHGLVDFYGLRDGEPVFLCWQRGEEAVGFYHELDAGFRGRKPLAP